MMHSDPEVRRTQRVGKLVTRQVDSITLVNLMIRAGWRQVSHRPGILTRLVWPGEDEHRGRSSVILHDRTTDEYVTDMAAVLRALYDAAKLGDQARSVLDELEASSPLNVVDEPDTSEQDVADSAWHAVWLHGKWRWITRNMTREERELAAAAVMRYSEKLAGVDGEHASRDGIYWWEY